MNVNANRATSTPNTATEVRCVANTAALIVAAFVGVASLLPGLASAQLGELFPLYTHVSAGYDHTCAVTTSGGVKCWGGNAYGELGDGTTLNSIPVVDVSELADGVSAVSAGDGHSCALTSNGAVQMLGQQPVR